MQTLNLICSWIPAVQDFIHPPPLRQYRSPDIQDIGVGPRWESIQLTCLIFHMLMRWSILIAACQFLSWMVADRARDQILNCNVDNHWKCQVSCWDRCRDACHGYMVSFSWCLKDEENEEKSGAFVSWFKKVPSDQYTIFQEWLKEMWMNI